MREQVAVVGKAHRKLSSQGALAIQFATTATALEPGPFGPERGQRREAPATRP